MAHATSATAAHDCDKNISERGILHRVLDEEDCESPEREERQQSVIYPDEPSGGQLPRRRAMQEIAERFAARRFGLVIAAEQQRLKFSARRCCVNLLRECFCGITVLALPLSLEIPEHQQEERNHEEQIDGIRSPDSIYADMCGAE